MVLIVVAVWPSEIVPTGPRVAVRATTAVRVDWENRAIRKVYTILRRCRTVQIGDK
ncbi:hypothetical protein D3C81_2274280 [compost metagenome]